MTDLSYTIEGSEAVAIQRFAAVWGDAYLHNDIGPRLTCSEAEALAGVLEIFAEPGAAEGFLDAHAEGDTDPEDDHYRGDD